MIPTISKRLATLLLLPVAITGVVALGGPGARSGPGRASSGAPHLATTPRFETDPMARPGRAPMARFAVDREVGWYEDWVIQDLRVATVAAPGPDGPAPLEALERSIPGGRAGETCLEVFEFTASFDPGVPIPQQILEAYAAKAARREPGGDRIDGSAEAGIDVRGRGSADESRFFRSATGPGRFTVTCEIRDGRPAPRFTDPSRAWRLAGPPVTVLPVVRGGEGPTSGDP